MPCRDYQYEDEVFFREKEEKKLENVRGLVQYVCRSLGITCPGRPTKDINFLTKFLCSTIKGMNEFQKDAYIYNGRSKKARALADWWEDHQERDKAREKEEQKKKREREVRKSALSKLTDEERRILGV